MAFELAPGFIAEEHVAGADVIPPGSLMQESERDIAFYQQHFAKQGTGGRVRRRRAPRAWAARGPRSPRRRTRSARGASFQSTSTSLRSTAPSAPSRSRSSSALTGNTGLSSAPPMCGKRCLVPPLGRALAGSPTPSDALRGGRARGGRAASA